MKHGGSVMIVDSIKIPCLKWCIQALPTVFDASLSYYEMVCKLKNLMSKMLNELVDDEQRIQQIENELEQLQSIINDWQNGGKEFFTEWFEKNFPSVVYFGLTDSGYFFVSYPDSWNSVKFNTTGLDIFPEGYEYGRLTLSY